MNEILEKLGQCGIVPVVVLNDSKDAAPLADALCAGGLACAEVTFRTEAAGAKFIVSPGLDPVIVRYCLEKEIPVTPGVVTPSEMAQAVALGLSLVKFFPAEPSGGLPMIHALAAAYTNLKFMPTGGINANNVKDYLKDDKIFACGGSCLEKGALVEEGNFEKIKELTREAANIVEEIRG